MEEQLLTWARLPGPQKVLAAARRRLQAGHGLTGSPLRVDLTPSEREEVGRLLGIAWVRSGRAVGARTLAEAVGSLGADVPQLLAATGEPVRDLRADRAASKQEALTEREYAARTLTDAGVPADTAAVWLSRRGLPAAGGGQLLDLAERCARVWRRLPAASGGRLLLTVLAASSLDDPHSLDRGSPVSTGILRLLGHELPDSAEAWRLAWEEHGVDCDPVSSRVLVLNLRMRGDAACARLTEADRPRTTLADLAVAQRDLPDRQRGRVRLREPVSPHRRRRHARRARPSPGLHQRSAVCRRNPTTGRTRRGRGDAARPRGRRRGRARNRLRASVGDPWRAAVALRSPFPGKAALRGTRYPRAPTRPGSLMDQALRCHAPLGRR